MKSILTPTQIKKSIVKITCDEEQGTGFLIDESLIITAYHVVPAPAPINIILFDNEEVSGELISHDLNFDIAIIKIEKQCEEFLPIQARTIRFNENWETNGFPYIGQANDLRIVGNVNQIQINDRSDFILNSEDIERDFDYSGFSGAPVVLSNKVGGIILQQEDNKLLAISIAKIKKYLLDNNIEVEDENNILDIPQEFEEDINSSTPNYENHELIDNTIKSSNKWYLLSGSPGSGKTISVASYLPEDENIEIVGKYFIKVPNDKTPKALKTSNRYFIQWLEEIIYLKLTGTPPPVDNSSFEKKLEKLPLLLYELGDYYRSKNKTGLVIIDGLDEIPELSVFLKSIPLELPDNLKVLLSCTSREILPSEIKSVITQNETIVAKPINLGQCEAFILKEVGKDVLNIEKIQELAVKSEGHPLYLRYLVNYIKNLSKGDLNDIDNWLNQIPTIGGDIRKYYDSLWDNIYEVPDKLWIIIILSWLRQSLKLEDLIKILPEPYNLSFISHFNNLKYLLKGDVDLEIYHNSFKDYVIINTEIYSAKANDYISQFCSLNSDHFYAINNLLYHQSQGTNKKDSIINCNQAWADKCALKSVSPELVIGDLKEIINISIDLKQTVETIRLLLLLQRIEFRYDSVFAENANLIASALISLNEYNAALKYLVRDNTLLVDNYDALLFLQLLYENGANTEGRILLDAISQRYRRQINEGMNSKKGIGYDTFMLQLNSLTLSMNDDFEEGFHGFSGLMQVLKRQQNYAEEQNYDEMSNSLYTIREYAASWQSAYALRRFDIYMESEATAKATGVKIDEKWAKMRASSLVLFDEIATYSTGVFEKTDNFFSAIKDVENLIEKYGFNEDKSELQILINSLIDNSKNSSLVKTLILKYLKFDDEFNFRKDNGVDLNYHDIHELYFKYKFKGYINDTKELPVVQNSYDRYKKWEDFSLAVLKNIAFLDGKSQFYNVAELKEELESAIKEYLIVLSKIDFTFDERSFWDRSYSLPEAIYPLIYSKVTWYLAQFSRKELHNFLQSFQSKSQNQAGLYSEGYRKSLFEIISGLVKANYEKDEINEFLIIWSKYVIDNVENRWERTSDLLKIIELYGLNSEKEKGIEMFKAMLKTSMGPSWYKEAQLDLLNTTLDLSNGKEELNKYLKEFAGILDYASGEMTFQRYVRYEKEVFIGNLIKSGKSKVAFDYFKKEVFPSPQLIIRNAEKSNFDSPRVGDGYCLGAKNIKEQSGILEILKTLNVNSSCLKWALTEIFTINDDVFRYISNFGNFQAQLLKYYEETANINLDEFYKSVVQIASSDELKDDVVEYLNCFKSQISEKGIRTIQGYLLKKEISWEIIPDEKESQNSVKNPEENYFEKFNFSYLKNDKARKDLIKEGTEAFKKERVNIWLGNWSTNSNTAKSNLKQIFSDEFEVFKYLKEFINHYSNDTWSITSKLIWFLEGKLSLQTTEDIYKTIAEHFKLLVRPDDETISKYDWIEEETDNKTNDELLTEFLIWFLNHPNKGFSDRTFESIKKLAHYEPELMIPALIKEVSSNEPNVSPVKCSLILKSIANEKPELISKIIKNESKLYQSLINVRHFSIKNNLLDVAISLNKTGYNEFYNEIFNSIPEAIVIVGDVALEDDYLEGIAYEIDELNQMQILNRKFCETLLGTIEEKCKPLSINDFIKSDKYLKRSFPNDNYFEGRFDEVLNYALNMAITSRVDRSNINEVYNILNY
jgi:hypothetical protein